MDKKKIKKRDGRVVEFTPTRITIAISKAMASVGQESLSKAEEITREICKEIDTKFFDKEKMPTVEEVQDTVEKHLILNKLPEVAKSYILYRDLRSRLRNINNLVDIAKLTEDYIDRKDWKVNENTSIDYSLSGLYNYVYSKIGEIYWLNSIFPKEIRELNENNDFHIHRNQLVMGLNNFYMAGQWVEPGGGMPTAAMSGRNVTQLICAKDKKKFVASKP